MNYYTNYNAFLSVEIKIIKITDYFFIWSKRILRVERLARYFFPWPTVHDFFLSTFAVQESFLVIADLSPLPTPSQIKWSIPKWGRVYNLQLFQSVQTETERSSSFINIDLNRFFAVS